MRRTRSAVAAPERMHLLRSSSLFGDCRGELPHRFAIAPHAKISLLLVSPESLDGAQAGTIFADQHAGLGRNLLVTAGLQELAYPETTRVASRTLGRKRVVRANDFVAKGDVGFRTQKEGTIVAHVLEKPAGIFGQNFDMLVGQAVSLGEHLHTIRDQDDLPVILPGGPRNVCGRQIRELAFNFCWQITRQSL